MRKIRLIWWQTYLRSVRHPAFLLFTLGVPGFLMVMGGAAAYFIFEALQGDRRPAAVVDPAGLLVPAESWTPANQFDRIVALETLPGEAQAAAALQAGTIQAYYVVPPDYVSGGVVAEVAGGPVSERVREQVRGYLAEGLLKATSAERRRRIAEGTTLLHRSLADQREMSFQLGFQWGSIVFVLAAFYFINSSSTSDMLGALREEEEKKTIEISLTSATVEQLLAGKVAGIISAGLTQFAVWAAGAAGLTALAWWALKAPGITLAAGPLAAALALCLALLLPAYVMSVTGVIVISSIAGLAGRGEQVASLVTSLLGTLAGPLAFIAVSSPDNPLVILFSILPITSPMVMTIRFLQVIVPAWQLALAIGLVWGLMIFNVAAGARVYRAKWLMSGQKNRLRAAWQALRG